MHILWNERINFDIDYKDKNLFVKVSWDFYE